VTSITTGTAVTPVCDSCAASSCQRSVARELDHRQAEERDVADEHAADARGGLADPRDERGLERVRVAVDLGQALAHELQDPAVARVEAVEGDRGDVGARGTQSRQHDQRAGGVDRLEPAAVDRGDPAELGAEPGERVGEPSAVRQSPGAFEHERVRGAATLDTAGGNRRGHDGSEAITARWRRPWNGGCSARGGHANVARPDRAAQAVPGPRRPIAPVRRRPTMRLLAAMFKHETNTFSPVPTPVERFFGYRPQMLVGQAAIDAHRGTGSGLGGFITVAEEAGAELHVAVAGEANPSGTVEDEAFDRIAAPILEAVARGGWDGILLDLHGAMVTRSQEDGEGELLRRIRAIDPKTPIGVTLDMHANLYDDIVTLATVVTGYHT
jgi:hypothetical protein